MCKVLWNHEEMDLCIGLATEMSRDEFIKEASQEHIRLTGVAFDSRKIHVNDKASDDIWRLEITE